MAKKMIDDIIATEARGNEIIKNAEIQADEIIADAKIKAAAIIDEAKKKAQAQSAERQASAEKESSLKSDTARGKTADLRAELTARAAAKNEDAVIGVLGILRNS